MCNIHTYVDRYECNIGPMVYEYILMTHNAAYLIQSGPDHAFPNLLN